MRKIFIICEFVSCGRIKAVFLNKNHMEYKDNEIMYFNDEMQLATYLDLRFNMTNYSPVLIYKKSN